MLPSVNSIKKEQDFRAVFRKAKSFRNNLFVFKTAKNGLDESRFGFVVSQKVSKKATTRNKIKRRLSEAIWAEMKTIKKGADSVLIALPGIEKKDFLEIKQTVEDALSKAGLVVKN